MCCYRPNFNYFRIQPSRSYIGAQYTHSDTPRCLLSQTHLSFGKNIVFLTGNSLEHRQVLWWCWRSGEHLLSPKSKQVGVHGPHSFLLPNHHQVFFLLGEWRNGRKWVGERWGMGLFANQTLVPMGLELGYFIVWETHTMALPLSVYPNHLDYSFENLRFCLFVCFLR